MDTAQFLEYVLPPSGVKFLALPKIHPESGREYFKHIPLEDFAQAQHYATGIARRGQNCYFACASYKQPVVEVGGKKKYRIRGNVSMVKAFWLDLDCGPGKDYPDQISAIKDVKGMCKGVGLPLPLLVNSGNGVHCYWALEDSISPDEWQPVAELLRIVADMHGVKQDGKCTTDVARVLRPVGTFNYKNPDLPKAVKLFRNTYPPPVSLTTIKEALTEAAGDRVAEVSVMQMFGTSSDLSAGRDYPPSSANEIAKRCQQVKAFAESGGNVDEPLWYQMLGLLKHTVEGEDVCQQWSSGHPSYSPEATRQKMDQWAYGPATCASIERACSAKCNGCQFRGEISSPIQLGHILPQNEAVEPPPAPPDEVVRPVFVLPEAMRERYSFADGKLKCMSNDSKGKPKVVTFSDFAFWPEAYHRKDGKMQVSWMVMNHHGGIDSFTLAGGGIGAGGQALFTELGSNGITATTGGKREMEMYINDWFNELRRQARETVVYNHYGWHDDGSFVLGEQRYLPNGDIIPIKLGIDAGGLAYKDAFATNGTVEQWADMVDKAYNYEGQEQYQMLIGVGFGAPLLSLFNNYGGVTFNGFSPEKGLGKSTALKLQLGIYGDPKKLIRTRQQVTTKAYIAHCGVMHSLPVGMDEATNIDPRDISDIIYTFSQGEPRQIMTRSGTMYAGQQRWSTLQTLTANRSMIGLVGAFKANADAEIGRMIEVQFHRVSRLTKEEADEILANSEVYFGTAGQVYVPYLVQNRERVKVLLEKTRRMLDGRIGLAVQDRFVSVGLASVVTGLVIASNLGLVRFNIKGLVDWLVLRARDLQEVAQQHTPPVEEIFATMMSELYTGVLVTENEGDMRAGKAAVVQYKPHGQIVGRHIKDQGVVYIQQSTIRKWCADNQADFGSMYKMAVERGWCEADPKTHAIGKGLQDITLPAMRCWKLDHAKMQGDGVDRKQPDKLYSIK